MRSGKTHFTIWFFLMLFLVKRSKDSCTSVTRLSSAPNDYGLTHVMAVHFIDKRAVLLILKKTKQNNFIPVYLSSVSIVDFGVSCLFCKRKHEESVDLSETCLKSDFLLFLVVCIVNPCLFMFTQAQQLFSCVLLRPYNSKNTTIQTCIWQTLQEIMH